MRDTMTLPAILDDCLRRLQAGETIAACLDHYPDQASELAPLLTAAARLRPLAGQRLSDAQRAQGRAVVRAAARTQAARATQPRSQQGWGWMKSRAFGLAMAGLATVLVLALAGTTVLASQPGDVSYPLRVVAERAPAALQPSPAGRANAELRIADRRLDDLESHLRATRQVEAAALAALIRGDEAAARRAIDLPETQRRLVAQRIDRHAAAILRLADRAENSRHRNSAATGRQSHETGCDPVALRPAAGSAKPDRTCSASDSYCNGEARVDGHAHGNENTDPSNSARTGFGSSDCHNNSDAHCMARAAARNLRATHRAARCARGTVNRHQPAWPHRHGNADPGHSIDPNTHRNHRSDNNCPSQPHTQAANHTAGEPHATAHSHARATDHASGPLRTPVPPITPRPTRTPRPPLTPRPQPTIQPTEIMEPTPTQTGVTATPTASGPQPNSCAHADTD